MDRDRKNAEFQMWVHEKKIGGQSRVIRRLFLDEVKDEYRSLPLGNTRTVGEDEYAIYDLSRVA